jgi:hypothetical protein
MTGTVEFGCLRRSYVSASAFPSLAGPPLATLSSKSWLPRTLNPQKVNFASAHWSPNPIPECMTVKLMHTTSTITPSRIINWTWLLVNFPVKPPLSSTDRKTVRIKRHAVAIPRAKTFLILDRHWGSGGRGRKFKLTDQEQLESRAAVKVDVFGIRRSLLVLHSVEEFEAANREYEQTCNLKGQACY